MVSMRLVACALPMALVTGFGAASPAQASFTSTSSNPFEVGNHLLGSNSCVGSGPLAGICTSNNSTTFTSSLSSFAGGNQHFVVNAVLSGNLSNGSTSLGTYSLTGVYNFTLTGRSSNNQLGTFALSEDFVDLNGTVFGMNLQLVQDPGIPSLGFASIESVSCDDCVSEFLIDIGLTVNALFVIGGSDPAPVSSVLNGAGATVPESPVWGMLIGGFGFIGYAMRRRAGARTLVGA